jgi:hypothetical protein
MVSTRAGKTLAVAGVIPFPMAQSDPLGEGTVHGGTVMHDNSSWHAAQRRGLAMTQHRGAGAGRWQ